MEKKPGWSMFRKWTLKRTFILFVAASLGLHLMLVGSGVVSEKIEKAREARLAEQQRQAALAKKQQVKVVKKELAKAALEETKAQVKANLKQQFQSLVAKDLQGDAADEVWDKILARLSGELDDFSQQVGNEDVSDAVVQEKMAQMQGDMLDELMKELRQMGAKKLADGFVDRVKTDIAPKLAAHYSTQIDRTIGTALRNVGTKIIADDTTAVRSQRQAGSQALAKAEGQVKAAQMELTRAQQHLEQQGKAAAGAKTDAQKQAVAKAVKGDEAAVAHAAEAIKGAQKLLADTSAKEDSSEGKMKAAMAAAADNPQAKGAAEDAATAGKAVADGKLPEASKASGEAAKKAGEFLNAIRTAKAVKENTDAALAARRGIKDARDEHIKGELDQSFKEQVVAGAVPKLSEGLADAFKKTLDDAGIKDDATVADVKKRIAAALGETVAGKVDAGKTGTGQLTRAGKLNEVGKGAGTSGGGAAPAGAATQVAAAGSGNGEAANAGEDGTDKGSGDAHEDAIAAKMKSAAKGITAKGMGDLAGDGGAEKVIAGALGRGSAGAGDDGGGDLAALAGRVARLAAMARGGQGLGDGDGAGGAGGVGGGGGLAQLRQSAFGRGRAAYLIRPGGYDFDKKAYEALAAKIQGRDMAAAQGQAIALQGTSGEASTDIASLVEAANKMPQAALIVAPGDKSKDPPVGIAEKKEPYKPSFNNIRFAAIPYRTKPVKMDGDLSEWADVPSLPMVAVTDSSLKHPTVTLAPDAPPEAIKVQWDNTGFYIAYDVKKADPRITKVKSGDFWEGDGAEVFVDTLNTKVHIRNAFTQQFWAWVDGAVNDPTKIGGEAISIKGHEEWNAWGKDMMQVASKKTATGWTMEVHIPRERFNKIDMEPGRIMGMNFSICTGSMLYYYWAGTTKTDTAMSPDTWGDVLLAGSDGKLECVDRLASELKQSETAKAISYLRIGEPLRIRVTSTVMNLSDKVKDKVSVSVASRHGGRQEVILEETGNSTGIFEGAIPTTLETGDPVLNTLSLYDGETLDITYNDQCRADGSRNVKVKLSLPTAGGVAKLAEK